MNIKYTKNTAAGKDQLRGIQYEYFFYILGMEGEISEGQDQIYASLLTCRGNKATWQ